MTPESRERPDGEPRSGYMLRGGAWTTRIVLFLGVFGVVFLSTGWTTYWYIVRHVALDRLNAAMASEIGFGREWSCVSVSSEGFPASVSLVCDSPRLSIQTESTPVSIRARRAVITASLFSLRRVTIDLVGPMTLENGGAVASVEWQALQFSARGLPSRVDRVSAAARRMSINGAIDPLSGPLRIGALQINVRKNGASVESLLNYEMSIAGVTSDYLDSFVGNSEDALVAATGSITDAALRSSSLVQAIEDWRTAGGRVAIANLSVVKGAFVAQADGALGLTESHRLSGNLDVRLHSGGGVLDGLAKRLGLVGSPIVAAARAMLGLNSQIDDVHVPLSISDGRVGAGPLKEIVRIPPLY